MSSNLKNQLLIATSNVINPILKRTVIYIYHNNQDSTMGLIINKPIENLKIKNILQSLNITTSSCLFGPKINESVIMGGVQSPEKGFILHTSKKKFHFSTQISDTIFMTHSSNILESTGTLEEPHKILVSLGYCMWNQNQIIQELIKFFWIIVPSNHDLLFNIPFKDRWKEAAKIIGINMYQLSNSFGHT